MSAFNIHNVLIRQSEKVNIHFFLIRQEDFSTHSFSIYHFFRGGFKQIYLIIFFNNLFFEGKIGVIIIWIRNFLLKIFIF